MVLDYPLLVLVFFGFFSLIVGRLIWSVQKSKFKGYKPIGYVMDLIILFGTINTVLLAIPEFIVYKLGGLWNQYVTGGITGIYVLSMIRLIWAIKQSRWEKRNIIGIFIDFILLVVFTALLIFFTPYVFAFSINLSGIFKNR